MGIVSPGSPQECYRLGRKLSTSVAAALIVAGFVELCNLFCKALTKPAPTSYVTYELQAPGSYEICQTLEFWQVGPLGPLHCFAKIWFFIEFQDHWRWPRKVSVVFTVVFTVEAWQSNRLCKAESENSCAQIKTPQSRLVCHEYL